MSCVVRRGVFRRLEATMATTAAPESRPRPIARDASTELAVNRTSLSFERTRMSTDNTLMSSLRTSLSLIGFGFTIHQVLGKASGVLPRASETGRNLGLALLLLGIAVLAAAILNHHGFERRLRRQQQELFEAGLMDGPPDGKITPTYVAAVVLLLIGLFAFASIAFRLAS